MLKRVLLGFLVLVVVVFAAAAFYVASRQNLRFDAPYPRLAYTSDSATIARGHYIVRVAAPCAACHSDPKQSDAYVRGEDVPLSGGWKFAIPPGNFYVRNITPDPETGIGSFGDSTIARALRHGVGHDGRALLPFMEMQGLSDEDLGAVVAYLKSQPPVRNPVPNHEYNLLGKVVRATVLANPVGPRSTPPAISPRGATVENGRYLVESVTLCGGCHTQRDVNTGAFTGQPLAGATEFKDEMDPSRTWSPPNITSGGRLGNLNEDQFVARFRAGRAIPGSPMPWQAFQKLDEDDLRAIYRFLMTVPKSTADVGPPFVKAKS
ncbi:MAG TPA: cytochrome C [Candidatus Eisenbacteria bacterium]|nr:cytochrome C [Candidatus Eisenbacteria bacterium]